MISLMQVDNSINLLFGVFASAGPADAGIIPIRGPLHLVVQKKPSKCAAETPLIIQYSYPPTDSFPNTSACPIMTNLNHSIKSETPDVKIEEISNLIFFTCCGEQLGYDDVRREWLVSYCSWPRACFEMSSFLPPSLAPIPLYPPLSARVILSFMSFFRNDLLPLLPSASFSSFHQKLFSKVSLSLTRQCICGYKGG